MKKVCIICSLILVFVLLVNCTNREKQTRWEAKPEEEMNERSLEEDAEAGVAEAQFLWG